MPPVSFEPDVGIEWIFDDIYIYLYILYTHAPCAHIKYKYGIYAFDMK